MRKYRMMAGGLLLALAACGSKDAADNSATAAPGATASGWKATDACAILDKAVVASTLGTTVQSATLDAVHAEGGGADLFSQCTFALADGMLLVFGTGQATNGASVPDQVKTMRGQLAMVSDTPPEDLPGIGKAALWNPALHALYAFLGDGRFVSATLSQPDFRKAQPPIQKVKANEIALVRKLGG